MKNNLADYFMQMVRIDSESGEENEFAAFITDELLRLSAHIEIGGFSDSGHGCAGNIFATIPGRVEMDPILFCCHLDTVKPGKNIEPYIEDGIIKSKGDTILGSDDKSGIAQLLYALYNLQESGIDLPPVEILFTACEEIGLLGAKYFDSTVLKSKFGFALDSKKIGDIVIGAPAQNTLQFVFKGKKAHAGFEPEQGVNAIKVCSHAIENMKIGRIDEETTANIGVIHGGSANNIIPDHVIVTGEVRSHSEEKLEDYTKQLLDNALSAVTDTTDSELFYDVTREYDSFYLDKDLPFLKLAVKAYDNIGMESELLKAGGGSDANVLNQAGIMMAVIGTGMDKVHTPEEQITVRDLELGSVWIEELISIYGNSKEIVL